MFLGVYLGLGGKKQGTADKQISPEAKKQNSKEGGKSRKAEKQTSKKT
jgi:hypothetical protein